MLDGVARRAIDPFLDRIGKMLAGNGFTANTVSLAGFLIGVAAAAAIINGWLYSGAALILLSRLCDGLDGVVARQTGATDFGGFLDIVLDFAFYGMIPVAFAIADPGGNALAAAVLVLSFYINGASFLAYAALAARRGEETAKRGRKTIYFTTGLAEATETLAVFLAFCLLPAWFAYVAFGFAGICIWTAVSRVLQARAVFT